MPTTPLHVGRRPIRRDVAVLAGSIWLGLIAFGSVVIDREALTPGAIAPPPDRIRLDEKPCRDCYHLEVAVHPRCPCSCATLTNLARIAAECGERLFVRVHVYQPAEADETWRRGWAWDAANRIPGAVVVADPEARDARALGALTSGSCVLYAPDGQAMFAGGLTVSRGHEGDSPMGAWIIATVTGDRDVERARSAPVFGCSITDLSAESIAGEGEP